MSKQKLLVVLGMHRSGTSAITRALQIFGANFGDRLMEADVHVNAKGFFEDEDIYRFNEQLLRVIGRHWHTLYRLQQVDFDRLIQQGFLLKAVDLLRKKMQGHYLYALKDPRISILLPFWQAVFEHCDLDVSYIVVIRHPMSVVASLSKRDNFEETKSYYLWLLYTLSSLSVVHADPPIVVVDFDDFMHRPSYWLDKMASVFLLSIDENEKALYEQSFLDQKLIHTRFQVKDLLLARSCPTLVASCYRYLQEYCVNSLPSAALKSAIQDFSRQLSEHAALLLLVDAFYIERGQHELKHYQNGLVLSEQEQKLSEQEQKLSEQEQKLSEQEQKLSEQEQKLSEQDSFVEQLKQHQHNLVSTNHELNHRLLSLHHSLSCRLTRPMRYIMDSIRKAKHSIVMLRRAIHQRGGLGALLKKAWHLLNRDGLSAYSLWRQRREQRNSVVGNYVYVYKEPVKPANISHQIEALLSKPLISVIIPVYNVDPKWLNLAIESVKQQWYPHWELCIVDDASSNEQTRRFLKTINHPKIKVRLLEENTNISAASNVALNMAAGDFIALLDHDDEITPDALYEVAKVINETDAQFIYSDEDFKTLNGECVNPHHKPDFSPDLLLSHNYITHFTVFKKSLLEEVGNFNSSFDGAQDYDLFLRLTEQTSRIRHIPKILYHWRMIETSTSSNSEAKPEALERGRKALEAAMQRRGVDATVENANLNHYFRVKYKIIGSPLVSIVIPFKDKHELLAMCINSILQKSTYKNFEIIGISNNSVEQTTFIEMKRLEGVDNRIKFYEYNLPFNYSNINNHAVNNYAKGEHILLLNNDIEIITPDWIESMLEHSQRAQIGCVGAKLYYPDDTIQHAGVIVGLGGYAAHSHKMYNRNDYGYFNRLNIVQNLSAVTGACLMVKKSIYQEMNGLDEENFKIAYNDVDFCLRVREAGYLNVFTPFSEAYHHESVSRGYEETAEKIARFEQEKVALYERHLNIIDNGDPFYNPNLTRDREDFSLA